MVILVTKSHRCVCRIIVWDRKTCTSEIEISHPPPPFFFETVMIGMVSDISLQSPCFKLNCFCVEIKVIQNMYSFLLVILVTKSHSCICCIRQKNMYICKLSHLPPPPSLSLSLKKFIIGMVSDVSFQSPML